MDIKEIYTRQSQFFASQGTADVGFRIEALRRLGAFLDENEASLLTALSDDLGKPKLEAYLSEIYFVKKEVRLFIKRLKRWSRPQSVSSPFYHFPERAYIRREPFGCALVIAPWNYPIQLSLAPLISAIGAGNCVILKPAEMTPATSSILAVLVKECFDPRHVSVVEGGVEESGKLLELSFDIFFFTGSERVGQIVAKAAANHLRPAILELGGKCPVVVDSNIDIDLTANRIINSKFFNAGQTCLAPDFVVANAQVYDALVEALGSKLKSCYSEGIVENLAQVVNLSHYRRLLAMDQDQGEIIQVGEDSEADLRLAPRIYPKTAWDSIAMRDEVFGPVLPVLKYHCDSELIETLRGFSEPLALYLFSRDQGFHQRYIDAIQSGSVGINDTIKQAVNFELPFGGVGGSGFGRYRGKFGFEAFTYTRSVSRRFFLKDIFALEPPYKGLYENIRKILK